MDTDKWGLVVRWGAPSPTASGGRREMRSGPKSDRGPNHIRFSLLIVPGQSWAGGYGMRSFFFFFFSSNGATQLTGFQFPGLGFRSMGPSRENAESSAGYIREVPGMRVWVTTRSPGSAARPPGLLPSQRLLGFLVLKWGHHHLSGLSWE